MNVKNVAGRLLFCLFGLLFLNNVSFAQADDDDDDPYESKSYLMGGLNYLSNNVFMGRHDSVVVPYITPYLGYHHASGVYAKALLAYANGKNNNRIDNFTLDLGYEHSFGNLNSGINAEKYFYNKNSRSVRANVAFSASAYAQYANKIVQPQVAIDFNKNKNSSDYYIGLSLDHEFKMLDTRLKLIPTFTFNLGTQNYYDEYFKARALKNDKTLKLKNLVSNASVLKPLDYEFSLKCELRLKSWLFTLTPTYVIPLNPAQITIPNQNREVSEALSNTFFVELDICKR